MMEGDGGKKNYIATANGGRIWHREPAVESPGRFQRYRIRHLAEASTQKIAGKVKPQVT
ncbi:MAG: hypothetical protein ACR2KU_01680 [Gammaproteobacteria bacterium]